MKLAFIDDSIQLEPSRDGMRPLVSAGAIVVDADLAGDLIGDVDVLCQIYGFPESEEFKWSPSRGMWMRRNLVDTRRTAFFREVLDRAAASDATVIVVISEQNTGWATNVAVDTFQDTVVMLLERIDSCAGENGSTVAITADEPGGGASQSRHFVDACTEVLRNGTQYSNFERTPFNVVTASSHHHRLLQVADVVTGASTAFVGGETPYSEAVFERIKPMFRHGMGTIGGRGLKLHSTYRMVNLYHWLVGDSHYWQRGVGMPLPMENRPYARSPLIC